MTKYNASTKSVATKLILIAASGYLASCSPNSPRLSSLEVRDEPLQLDQLTDADRAELEAWLNGPIAARR